ncbi:hypothetical protein [Massilia sp. TS11]|uniref:hypothetical protein n=1 Tax=Massilia sp. TS11 TaxID=2908003 RepID=UPI001EDB1D15|nr:hypothetical protein [Massilia sp. TS11]MCG2586791.1 hypothetical protein [Massilia sp. TS11]
METETSELSGEAWVARWPGSSALDDLAPGFRAAARAFLAALQAAGVQVLVSATYRPPERAWLMHWSYAIVRLRQDPRTVPARAGVPIDWVHHDEAGAYSWARSFMAARAMVRGYDIVDLDTAPAIDSRHTAGCAIDMSLAWHGDLLLRDAGGRAVRVVGAPRDGMHPRLAEVGRSYGLIKFSGGAADRPHWSDNGR